MRGCYSYDAWCPCRLANRTAWARSSPGGVRAPTAAVPAQRPSGKRDPWRTLGAVAPPPGLVRGSPHVPTTRMAVPRGYSGEVGPLYLGIPAHPRRRATRHTVTRGDQPICRVAATNWHRRPNLLLLAAAAKWLLAVVVIVVAGTSLLRSTRPGPEVLLPQEVLPRPKPPRFYSPRCRQGGFSETRQGYRQRQSPRSGPCPMARSC